MEQEVLKRIVAALRCSQCGASFKPEGVDFLGSKDDMWYFMVDCSGCGNREMVAALVQQAGEAEQCTDLTESETGKFVHPVESDDLIDIHLYLKDFGGDFKSLFGGG
jgi:DNA-directed RNA polymerase subunit RPC12/RpoP